MDKYINHLMKTDLVYDKIRHLGGNADGISEKKEIKHKDIWSFLNRISKWNPEYTIFTSFYQKYNKKYDNPEKFFDAVQKFKQWKEVKELYELSDDQLDMKLKEEKPIVKNIHIFLFNLKNINLKDAKYEIFYDFYYYLIGPGKSFEEEYDLNEYFIQLFDNISKGVKFDVYDNFTKVYNSKLNIKYDTEDVRLKKYLDSISKLENDGILKNYIDNIDMWTNFKDVEEVTEVKKENKSAVIFLIIGIVLCLILILMSLLVIFYKPATNIYYNIISVI